MPAQTQNAVQVVRSSFHDVSSSFSTRSMTPRPTRSNHSLHALYNYVLRRAWKRVTRATRREQRASVLPDGFVLVGAASANARRAARRSVLFA